MNFSACELLGPAHDVSTFDCGEPALTAWLRDRAVSNQRSGASRTYVVCAGERVAGYYALSAASVSHRMVPGAVRRNMPDPVPVLLLGRLAVDREFRGQGLATHLLRDAARRTLSAAGIAGIRALMVSAIDEAAERFYAWHGYQPSPVDPALLFLPIETIRRWLA